MDSLFVTTNKPHTPASKDTIGRWISVIFRAAGIDTAIFGPHSCRAASSSTARAAGVSIDTILVSAQWKSSCVFKKFYDKNIVFNDITEHRPFMDSMMKKFS